MTATSGAITGYIDVAQVTLYAFWIFFAGLVYYLRREDKREGYPLFSDDPLKGRRTPYGLPGVPPAKTFVLPHVGQAEVTRTERDVSGVTRKLAVWEGAPLTPTGNPLKDAVGPASYAERQDVPDLTYDEQLPKIVPLRAAPGYHLAAEDSDPRGFKIMAADGRIAGTVVECWIDRSETLVRYYEAEVPLPGGGSRRVLFPAVLGWQRPELQQMAVDALMSTQFADAPTLKNPDQITLLEEDKVSAYFAGGYMYATAARVGPLL